MTTKTIHIGGSGAENLSLRVAEAADAPYGCYIWPCGLALARYVWKHRQAIKGKHILEIGAGCAVPGVTAGKAGGLVTLSDAAHLSQAKERALQSCQLNQLPGIPFIPLTWGQFHPSMFSLSQLDIILGSDCFYDSRDFQDILVTVSFLLQRHPEAEFWTTYQQRNPNWSIEALLSKWGLIAEEINIDDLKFVEGDGPAEGMESVCMVKMKLNPSVLGYDQ